MEPSGGLIVFNLQNVKKYQSSLSNCSKHWWKILYRDFNPFISLILIYTNTYNRFLQMLKISVFFDLNICASDVLPWIMTLVSCTAKRCFYTDITKMVVIWAAIVAAGRKQIPDWVKPEKFTLLQNHVIYPLNFLSFVPLDIARIWSDSIHICFHVKHFFSSYPRWWLEEVSCKENYNLIWNVI